MVLTIILVILITVLLALLLMFLFYILFPAIKEQTKVYDDPVISGDEVNYRAAEVHEKTPVSDKKAFVMCNCKKEFALQKVNFNSEYTCRMINSVYGTGTDCKFSCIGLGDCVKVCPQSAIIIQNKTAVVTNLCVGCGKCIDACPLKIIKLIQKDDEKLVICANTDDDKVTCTAKGKEENIVWNDKKGFKIWSSCYKIYIRIRDLIGE